MRPTPIDDVMSTLAGRELLQTYPALLAFFRRKLPPHRRAEAEDLAQDTVVVGMLALREDGERAVQSMRPYVLGIARNLCNQVLRTDYRIRHVALDGLRGDDRSAISTRVAADHERMEEELHKELLQALSKLPPAEHAMLYLRFFEGLDNEEASRRLGIRPDVGSRLKYRALERIRSSLSTPRAR